MVTTKWLTQDDDLIEVIRIRRRVFIDECGMGDDFIASDANAQILLVADSGVPMATGRITTFGKSMLLGQIAVLPEYRGRAYGDFVIRLLIRRAFELGAYEQYVFSRPEAVGFYQKLGFTATGEKAKGNGVVMRHTGDILGHC